ncbi:MAG: hypothetical protein JSV07_00445 [Acidimicrobiia bacterium]|nr:MAG: hypothetical protein JSV07_00445 [Acidimicrobiia bacterium]
MSRDRALIIANPAASSFTGAAFREVSRVLSDRWDLEQHWPESPSITHALTREAPERGITAVFAMGGDGVVHHAAQGLVGTDVPLGVIPSGTTNVLARILELPSRAIAAGHHHLEATVRVVPTIRLTVEQEDGETTRTHALFALGFGFDADVVELAEAAGHRKRTLGAAHYAISTVRQFMGYVGRRPHAMVDVGDGPKDAVAAQVQLHDIYTFFGPIPLRAGPSSPGALTVATYRKLTPWMLPGLAIGAATGRGGQVHNVEVALDRSTVKITAVDDPLHAQADGEPLGQVHSVIVDLAPDSLRVFA